MHREDEECFFRVGATIGEGPKPVSYYSPISQALARGPSNSATLGELQ